MGYIGYKIVMAFQAEDVPLEMENTSNYKVLHQKDTMPAELILNYENPFLKQEPIQRNRVNHYGAGNQNVVAPKPQKSVATEIKPQKEIKYLGTIQNKTSGMMMALISIEGNSYTIKKGVEVEGFSIKNITNSYIEVKEGKNSFKVGKGVAFCSRFVNTWFMSLVKHCYLFCEKLHFSFQRMFYR